MRGKSSNAQRLVLYGLKPEEYEHSLDRKALNSLEGTPGLEILMRKISEYGIEYTSRMQFKGSYIAVNEKMLSQANGGTAQGMRGYPFEAGT